MASKKSSINVIATTDSLKVFYFNRTLTIQLEPLNDEPKNNSNFVIKLDEIEFWDPPDNTKTVSIIELTLSILMVPRVEVRPWSRVIKRICIFGCITIHSTTSQTYQMIYILES